MGIKYTRKNVRSRQGEGVIHALMLGRTGPTYADYTDELLEETPISHTDYTVQKGADIHDSKPPGWIGRYPTADMTINHYAPYPYFTDTGMEINDAIASSGGHPQLFHTIPSKIEVLRSDRSITSTAPTLLGLALNDHGKLQVSEDLSKHSSRIAKKGVEAGAVYPPDQNYDMEVSNDIDFQTRHHLPSTDPVVSNHEVELARNTVRKILRPSSHLSTEQFSPEKVQHPQLPGLED